MYEFNLIVSSETAIAYANGDMVIWQCGNLVIRESVSLVGLEEFSVIFFQYKTKIPSLDMKLQVAAFCFNKFVFVNVLTQKQPFFILLINKLGKH